MNNHYKSQDQKFVNIHSGEWEFTGFSSCKYCGRDIYWMRSEIRAIPKNRDGLRHQCNEYVRARAKSG